ncbi:MAG: tRNA uridine-5-carboxymethylaminomethyl(34) synthesis GTPase MnmE [Endomicrobium sp.]|jgi:tRNA modification GTPase|nr:tRNA uridine-5-carboxymethylaminomethyl(34) synthesis GTPase MnmE [Endomicrobium sp.]
MNYLSEDTIAALSTAAGKSAVAVIRLSGGHSSDILNKIFKPLSQNDKQIKYGFIADGGNKIDEVLCTFFKAPGTYTGEDLIEISCHGNPVIINEILNLLYKNGARPAQPGEFTYRAFLNGKKDLAQAEAVCALISGKTAAAAKAALNNVSGEFSNKIKNIKDPLIDLLSFVEVSLDHPEEDVMFLSREEKALRLGSLIEQNQKLLDSYKISESLQKGLKAAIIGKPNAGKSSLLNAILGKNRAIVTEIAGTTTDTIEEIIDCRGIPLTIIDTAGIRTHSENSIELLGQERSKEAAQKADLIIWVTDGSQPLDKNDKEIADFITKSNLNIPIIEAVNKTDLVERQSEDKDDKPSPLGGGSPRNNKDESDAGARRERPGSEEKRGEGLAKQDGEGSAVISAFHSPLSALPLKLSAKTGDGIPELLDAIAKIAGITDSYDHLMITSRHFALLNTAQSALSKAKDQYALQDADEIAAFELRAALAAYEDILGITTQHDILDTIFSTFCIGK